MDNVHDRGFYILHSLWVINNNFGLMDVLQEFVWSVLSMYFYLVCCETYIFLSIR